MKQWNLPNYQGVTGRFLSPHGVKDMANCHYSMANLLEMLLKVSKPIDLDKTVELVEILNDKMPNNLDVLNRIDHLPLMYGQNGFGTRFVPFANGGFQIDLTNITLPGGDWETLLFRNTESY